MQKRVVEKKRTAREMGQDDIFNFRMNLYGPDMEVKPLKPRVRLKSEGMAISFNMGSENSTSGQESCGICCQQGGKSGQALSLFQRSRLKDKLNLELARVLKTKQAGNESVPDQGKFLEMGDTKYYGLVGDSGLPQGVGEMVTSANYLMGVFNKGVLNGKSRIVSLQGKSSSQFIGTVQDGQPTEGLLTIGGYRYRGGLKQGRPEGSGEEWLENGDHFKGTFHDGSRYEGRYEYARHPRMKWFQGKMSKGEVNPCMIGYQQGELFQGFSKDTQLVRGKYRYSNGDIYEGGFKDGKREGPGRYYFRENGVIFEGLYKDNERGEGQYFSTVG